jgi:hypothetical protein
MYGMMMKYYLTQFASQNLSGHKKNFSEKKYLEVRYTHRQKRLPTISTYKASVYINKGNCKNNSFLEIKKFSWLRQNTC